MKTARFPKFQFDFVKKKSFPKIKSDFVIESIKSCVKLVQIEHTAHSGQMPFSIFNLLHVKQLRKQLILTFAVFGFIKIGHR